MALFTYLCIDYFDLTCYFADKKIVQQDIYANRLEFESGKGKKNMCSYKKKINHAVKVFKMLSSINCINIFFGALKINKYLSATKNTLFL